MKNPKPTAGDLYVIPGGDRFAIGKIIYVSQYFKNVILVRLFSTTCNAIEESELPSPLSESSLIYTGTGAIKSGGWRHFGKQELLSFETEMTKRIIGGDIWLGDTCLGPASNEDLSQFNQMRVKGFLLVAKAVSKLHSKITASAP